MRPFVLIGTGGSGGKTVRMVREVLKQRLDAADWAGDWPKAWQLLHIDVPAIADGVSADLPYTLPREDYFPLTDTASTYGNADLMLARLKGDTEARYRALDSWRPVPPDKVRVNLTMGAGQYRAVGRVAVLAQLGRVNQRILQAINEARSASPDVLAELEKLLHVSSGTTAAQVDTTEPMVIIAGSVAGGSGSGSLLDICDLVRASTTTKPIALLFAPELFAGISGASSGLAPNTFMALNEISNAMWVSAVEDSPESRQMLFGRDGITASRGQGGPYAALLVGSRNEYVHLGASTEIYQVMGRALAEWVTTRDLQDAFTAYILGNAEAMVSGIDDYYPVKVANAPGPQFFGLGFSRLSIGREHFQRYATERLARTGVVRLLDYHLSLRQPGDNATDLEMITRVAEATFADFMHQCGLSELGAKDNQVLDGLAPDGVSEMLAQFTRSETMNLMEGMGGKKTRSEDVRAMLAGSTTAQLQAGGRTMRSVFESLLFEQAAKWCDKVQDDLAAQIPVAISSVGLPVTLELLNRAIGTTEQAAAELKQDAARYAQASRDRHDQLRTPLASGPAKIKADEEALSPLIAAARECIALNFDSILRGLAAEILEDLAENLLGPWRTAVTDCEALLRLEVRPSSGAASVVDFWPGSQGVPAQYLPSKIEFLLEDPEDFPLHFEAMIVRSVPDEDAPGDAETAAVRELLIGLQGKTTVQLASRPPVKRKGDWIPGPAEVRERTSLPAPASVELRFTVEDVHDRASEWIRDTKRYCGTYLRQSMAEFLQDTDVHAGVRSERRTTLVGQFQAMLQTASPLVSLNPTLLQEIHTKARQGVGLIFTPLNVPDDPELKARLRDVAVQTGLSLPGRELKDDRLFTDSRSQSSQAFQVHEQGAYQLVFDSVMEPLANRWAKVKDDDRLRHDFWKYRRTRPLQEWAPVDPDTRRALVLGWLTGRLLGEARVVVPAKHPTRLEVWSDYGQGPEWASMPVHGPRPVTRQNAPANVLELLPVGIIESYAEKSLRPLRPWEGLLKIAGAVGGDRCPIASWIRSGTGALQEGEPQLPEMLDATPDARKAMLKERLITLGQQLEDNCRVPAHPDILELQAKPVLEIYDDYRDAIDELREASAKAGQESEGLY